MSTYRLCNTSYTEPAFFLPFPSLPVCFGASSQELRLAEDGDGASRVRTASSTTLLSQASKVAELLQATDVSYLSLRDNARSEGALVSKELGSFHAAVLQHNPDAFSYSAQGPNKQSAGRNSSSDRSERNEDCVGPSHNVQKGSLVNPPEGIATDVQAPISAAKSKIRRKDTIEDRIDCRRLLSGAVDFEHDSGVGSFCEMLDGIFERTEMLCEREGDEGDMWLPFSDIKLLSEGLLVADSKNTLHLVPVGHIVRLLDFLNRHIQHACDRAVDDVDDVNSDNFITVMSASEAVQMVLTIMTHQNMPKQVYKEEIIDRIIEFTRHQIVHSVFTAYDPSYRMIHKGGGIEVDNGDEKEDGDIENKTGKKGRRKSKGRKFKEAASAKVSSTVSSVLHKLCSILGSLKDLLSIERLLDSSVLQLIKTSLATFAVDNIQLLQLKAIGVTCAVFCAYSGHRTVVMDEITRLLWKLPSSKRNLRAYHLLDEEQKQIQMITALVIQLVQCSVTLPEPTEADFAANAAPDTADVACSPSKCFEPAMESCRHFWGNVLQWLTVPKCQDGSDIKVILENLVVDLLTTLNVPEYPAASLLLQVLCVLLFGNAGLKSKDVFVRGIAIDLLGQIAARLKHDSVVCGNDRLWILQELQDEQLEDDGPLEEMCVVCFEGRGAKFMVICDGCQRWFHGDCIGVTGHDLISRGWICHCCLCRRQLVSLVSHFRVQGEKTGESCSSNLITRGTTEVSFPISGVDVVQQILLNHLQEVGLTDTTARYACQFYLCQWYKDDPNAIRMLPLYNRRQNSKAPVLEFGIASAALSRDIVSRISATLGQQRSLARGFDKILDRLLASLQENSPTPRAKALRAVSAIVEVDPGVLGDTRVKSAVEGRFLDSAISVREAAMELVGRHIVSRPDVAVKYFKKIAERIMDTGVSVRKRVIKIIRDICISKCEFAKSTDACFHIISRINDEETSIQDLVCKTFYELWFEEPSDAQTQFVGDGSIVPLEIAERTQQLVNVLSMLNSHQPLVIIIKRTLALDFCSSKNTGTSAVSQAAVRNRCELMCKFLLESILKAEETNSAESEIHALPYVLALHAFCAVDPSLCAPASDPSRFVVTLQTYLKSQVDNRVVAQLLQSILFVIDAVLPLLRRPPPNFVEELERDLRQLIVRYSFLSVVHACIKCLCSLSKVASKGVTSFEFLVQKFFKYLDVGRKVQYGTIDELHVLRCLYCLGLLVRYGTELLASFDKKDISIEQLLSLYKHYLHLDDCVVKARSLQALGFLCIAKPEFMMEKEIGKILEASLSTDADTRIKVQVLRNFYDYLVDVEEQMGIENIGDNRNGKQHGTVPVAAGVGDSNICGGIIQLHCESILEKCLDMNDQVRQSALKVVEIALRQGLVHPVSCVAYLIALEVDQQELNSNMAHSLLVYMNEKYPSFFESRMGDGIQLSFRFILSGASSCVNGKISGDSSTKHAESTADSAKAGIARMYRLIQRSRPSRNKFMTSVIHKFDSASLGSSPLPFLVYCTEVLAALPFSIPDEPLYLVSTINRTLQLRAGSLEASMKNLISQGPLKAIVKRVLKTMEADQQCGGEEAYNIESVEVVDDLQGALTKDLQNLKANCHAAVAFTLLLRLKRHIKVVFGLSDARCQTFSASEPIKSGEALSRQSIPFTIKDLPIAVPTTIHQMLQQYQDLKRSLKEDSMDYSNYTVSTPRKRARATTSQADTMNGNPHSNGHLSLRSLRRKSLFSSPKIDKAEFSEGESEDGNARQQKRKRLSGNGGLPKRKKKPL